MPDFFVQRLPVVAEERRYHLCDDQGQLVLVADYRSPWLLAGDRQTVRLARPDGKLVASLDMTNTRPSGRQALPGRSYAIIHDYAVYGIVNELREGPEEQPYFTIEVEGQRWLALSRDEDVLSYALYDRLPGQLGRQAHPDTGGLPEPVGFLKAEYAGSYDYAITLPAGLLRQRELVVLSLTFMIDNAQGS